MFKKLFLVVIAVSFLCFPAFAFAQEARDLTTTPSVTNSFDDFTTTSDYTTDFNWNDLSPDEQAAATGLATMMGGAFVVVMIVSAVIGVASYIFMSFALMTIGNKIGIKDSWFVWVPFLNLVFFVRVSGINPWLLLLILVPGVNAFFLIYFMAISYMNMSEKRGLDKLMGLLVFIPIVQFIFTGYLAWGKITPKAVAQPVKA